MEVSFADPKKLGLSLKPAKGRAVDYSGKVSVKCASLIADSPRLIKPALLPLFIPFWLHRECSCPGNYLALEVASVVSEVTLLRKSR